MGLLCSITGNDFKNPKTSSERRKVEKTMTQVLKLQTLNSHLATTGLEDAFMSSISGLCPTENLYGLHQLHFEQK